MNYFQPPFPPPGYPGYPYGYQPFAPQATQIDSTVENVLRLNLGKQVSVYMHFPQSQWGSKVFKGTLEAAAKDHLILCDHNTQMRYLLLTEFLNYLTFEEEINYFQSPDR